MIPENTTEQEILYENFCLCLTRANEETFERFIEVMFMASRARFNALRKDNEYLKMTREQQIREHERVFQFNNSVHWSEMKHNFPDKSYFDSFKEEEK